ncbi:hypothetical protein GOV10_05975 [Candidatus Woesearchaeota archaeon]|nr:hypothetical protein [Candidatus Woesearchaeota archaeon]
MKQTMFIATIFILFLALFATTASAKLELTGEQFIILGEDSSIDDVLTGVTIIQFLKGAGYDAPVGSSLIDKDAYETFTESMMDDYVFYVIDDKKVDILLGKYVIAQNKWIAEQTKDFLEDEGYTVNIITNPEREDLLVTYEPPTEEYDADDQIVCTMDAKECPDGSFVGRIAPDCEFKECPEFVPEDSPPEEQVVVCQGCEQDEECIPYGTRLDGQRYCALNGEVSAQKDDGASCSEHVECKTQCNGTVCQKVQVISKNILVRAFSWFINIFR